MRWLYVNAVSFLLTVLWFPVCSADSINMSFTVSPQPNGSATVNYTLNSWDPETALTSNPCYGTTSSVPQCAFAIAAAVRPTVSSNMKFTFPQYSVSDTCAKTLLKESSIADLVKGSWSKCFGLSVSGSIVIPSSWMSSGSEICIGPAFVNGRYAGGWAAQSGFLTASGGCEGSLILPPVSAVCEIQSPIEIDHGTVSASELNQHTATKDIHIVCNKETTASLSLLTYDLPMTPNSSFSSRLYLNGVNKASRLTLPAGTTGVQLKSILSADDRISAGTYSGSTVLILTIL